MDNNCSCADLASLSKSLSYEQDVNYQLRMVVISLAILIVFWMTGGLFLTFVLIPWVLHRIGYGHDQEEGVEDVEMDNLAGPPYVNGVVVPHVNGTAHPQNH
ncbi:hypothetical protein F5Y10DRAFT_262525 [Nemania abortiva]|nr:hypothetical protein F5Y10DRAFT_262525 [Nemania abortiva]